MNKDLKIVFLGTPDFAVPTLKALIKNDLRPFLVITQPDKPVGRKKELTPPPVKIIAVENNIEVKQPANKKELEEIFNTIDVDVCVLVAFGMIIPQVVLDKPKHGFINVHPSLLPKYRGPSPIQYALLKGETKTGVTIMQLTFEMDAGPILAQQEVAIGPQENYSDLHDSLSVLGADLVIENLPKYLSGDLQVTPQDEAGVTFCKMIKREDGQIDWSKSTNEIINQFRAFHPWPGVFTYIGEKRLRITNLGVLGGDFKRQDGMDLAVGEIFLEPNGELAIKCQDGAIALLLVQLEGKKEVTGQEFYNGHKNLIGQILEYK